MSNGGFRKLFWGIFFIMLNFRIQGFDIFPNVVGYILLAVGFSALSPRSNFFDKAARFNIPMIFLSLLSLYEQPVQSAGIQMGWLGIVGIPLSIISFILNLLVFYNLFMGIKDMAEQQEQYSLAQESGERWRQYMGLQFAVLFTFVLMFIPPFALIYIFALFVITIAFTISILRFIRRCEETFDTLPY